MSQVQDHSMRSQQDIKCDLVALEELEQVEQAPIEAYSMRSLSSDQ